MVYIDHSANRKLAHDLERAVKDAKGKSYDEPLNGNEGCGIMFIMFGLACFVIGVVFLPIGLVERSKLPSIHPDDLFLYMNASTSSSTSSSGGAACQLSAVQYSNETKRECCGGGNGKESPNVCYESYHLEYKVPANDGDAGGNMTRTMQHSYYHQREACRDKSSCDKCPNESLKGKSFLGVEGDYIDCWKLAILPGDSSSNSNSNSNNNKDLSSKEWKKIYEFWNCSKQNNPRCYIPIDPTKKYEGPDHTSRVDVIVGATMLGGFGLFLCLGLLCVRF